MYTSAEAPAPRITQALGNRSVDMALFYQHDDDDVHHDEKCLPRFAAPLDHPCQPLSTSVHGLSKKHLRNG